MRSLISAFFLGGRRGKRAPKHFVNLTGESKNFKMLELRIPLNIFLEKKAVSLMIVLLTKYYSGD
jgi:hypothetical protein